MLTDDTRSLVVEAVTANPDGFCGRECSLRRNWSCPRSGTKCSCRPARSSGPATAARVFVVQEDGLREQVVAVGQSADGRVEILSGLQGGERLLADAEKGREGSLVRR